MITYKPGDIVYLNGSRAVILKRVLRTAYRVRINEQSSTIERTVEGCHLSPTKQRKYINQAESSHRGKFRERGVGISD